MEEDVGEIPMKASPQTQFLALMILLLVLVLQISVQLWKKWHQKSYNYATLFLMWLFPFCMSCLLGFWKFILVWIIFSTISLWMGYLATRKPLAMKTPRKVYSLFYYVYVVAHGVTLFGFFCFLLDVFGVINFFHSVMLRHLLEYTLFRFIYSDPIVIIFYGLYFSVLVRDAAEICAEQMAFQIEQGRVQFYQNETTLSRTCGICDGGFELDRDLEGVAVVMKQEYIADNKLKLECGHTFHEFCIKGWSIIGKKEYCPVCKEKVNIKDNLSKNPWETDSIAWIQFLDIVRYVIVWNPLIIMVLQILLWIIKI